MIKRKQAFAGRNCFGARNISKILQHILLLTLIAAAGLTSVQAQTHDLYGIWVKRAAFGNAGNMKSVDYLVTDEQDNQYILGTFTGTLNFSDDLCVPINKTAHSNANVHGYILVKYDKDGKYQWSVVFKSNSNSLPNLEGTSLLNTYGLEYANGKIALSGKFYYLTGGVTFPLKVQVEGPLGNKSIERTGPGDGVIAHGCYAINFVQIIDAQTGAIGASISNFSTGTRDLRHHMVGDEIITLHEGSGNAYYTGTNPNPNCANCPTNSFMSKYDINTGAQIGANLRYPGQPVYTPEPNTSRPRGYTVLSDGSNIIVQIGVRTSDPSGATAAFWLLKYNQNFSAKQIQKGITAIVTDPPLPPQVEVDASDNLYLMTNYGNTKYWNTPDNIPNSNSITNYLGVTGANFATRQNHNKLLLSRLAPDFTVAWTRQLGVNSTTAPDGQEVYGYDVKVKGGYTYIVGRFRGTNVPFGNGKTLSSNGGADGFYAVYDNADGNCVYAVNMGGTLADSNNSLALSGDKVTISGTYLSAAMQTDPSGRLYPLAGNGTNSQGFIAHYSLASDSEPTLPGSSFGDAPASYGLAAHYVCNCLKIGGLDHTKLQEAPVYSLAADSDENDDGFTQVLSGGFTNLSNANHSLAANGMLTIRVRATNTSTEDAKLMAWIDFNQNGVFDPDEASSPAVNVVKTTTNNAEFQLTWAGAAAKMRNGKTYLRIRLATDNINSSQSAGLFFNGEVEDYKLNFDVMEVSKSVSPTVAKKGDVLKYTINIKNKLPNASLVPTAIFDPIPEHTTYVAGSADPTGATTGNISIGGESLLALRWGSIAAIAPGAERSYKFNVTITEAPQLSASPDSLISNVAYAALNGDSIPSTGAGCNLAQTEVIVLDAVNDTAATVSNTTTIIDVLANDEIQGCTPANVTLGLSTVFKPQNGQASITSDNKIQYIPDPGFNGVDSFRYLLIGCPANQRSDSATVYIAVLKQEALNYVACTGATVSLGMTSVAGLSYYWYNAPVAGSTVAGGSGTRTLTVVKGSTADIGTWWVEARYGAIKFPRHKIQLLLSDNCGTTNPQNCAATGTVIWKEDFDRYDDGLNPASNVRSTEQLPPGLTTYSFGVPGQSAGVYSLLKRGVYGWEAERVLDDHTSPNNNTIGRLLLINGKETPDQVYKQDIPAVCANTALYFSFWAGGCDAQLRLTIYSSDDNSILSICEFPSLPDGPSPIVWKHYGFTFQVPAGISSIYFDFYNYWGSWGGNDFAIDDIEVRLCAPPVTGAKVNGKAADTICAGAAVTLTSDEYDDLGIFAAAGDNLKGYWIRSFTGDVNNPADWSPLPGSEVTDNAPLPATTFTDYPPANDTVYYRFAVSNAANIGKPNCRVASAALPVVVRGHSPTYPDVRLQLCAGLTPAQLHLSSYLDTVNFKSVQWSRESSGSPNFVGATATTTGTLNTAAFSLGTHIYKYEIESHCATGDGRVYVKNTTSPVVPSLRDTIVVCHSAASASHLQLNQMLGIEAAGNWQYNSNLSTYLHAIASPSNFAGAYIFDAAAAWQAVQSSALPASYKITYNGDAQAAAFTFGYATGPQTCFGNKTRELVLVITSRVLPLH